MLQNYYVPTKLRTLHHPGQQIELWIDDKRISKIGDLSPMVRPFVQDFVDNLEHLGWKVLIQAYIKD